MTKTPKNKSLVSETEQGKKVFLKNFRKVAYYCAAFFFLSYPLQSAASVKTAMLKDNKCQALLRAKPENNNCSKFYRRKSADLLT